MSRWKGIKTAPQDGTQVDLWTAPPGLHPSRITDCWFEDGLWWRNEGRVDWPVEHATHWMTPPKGPTP